MYDILELKKKKLQDLQDIANKLKISELKRYMFSVSISHLD